MIEGTIQADFPVFRVESTVGHYTPRVPTAFERMILRLVVEMAKSDYLRKTRQSLESVFERQLGVRGAPDLLTSTIEDLIVLGVFQGSQDEVEVSRTPICDLRVSEEGRQFYERNELPSRIKQEILHHDYYFESESIIPVRDAPAGSENPVNPLEIDQPSDAHLSEVVRSSLSRERHRWKTDRTVISSVQSRVEAVLWRPIKISLSVRGARDLELSAGESGSINTWLQDAEPDFLRDELITPALSQPGSGNQHPVMLSSSDDAAGDLVNRLGPIEVPTASLAQENLPSGVTFRISRQVLSGDAESGSYRIQHHDGSVEVSGIPDDALPDQFVQLEVSQDTRLQDGTSGPAIDVIGVLPVRFRSHEIAVPVKLRLEEEASLDIWRRWEPALTATLVDATVPETAAIPAIWGSTGPIERMVAESSGADLMGQLQAICTLRETVRRIGSSDDPEWERALIRGSEGQLFESASSLADVSVSDGLRLLAELRRAVQSEADLWGLLAEQVLACMEPVDSESDLAEVQDHLPPALAVPVRVIGDRLMSTWLIQASDLESSVSSQSTVPEPYAARLSALGDATRRLMADVGPEVLDRVGSGTSPLAVSNLRQAVESARRWSQAHGDIVSAWGAERAAPSRLVELASQVAEWLDAVRTAFAPPTDRDVRYVVLDTSVLMEHPEVLGKIRDPDVVVVPHVVLKELEGLEKDARGSKAKSARRATRELERHQISYYPSHPELLPHDLNSGNDSEILSAAVWLSLSDVVLVTGDKNMRQKAEACVISAMTPREFYSAERKTKGRSDR